MKKNTIVLGTSLAPRKDERQLQAVKSWLDNGFKVVSCNTKREIEILETIYHGIEFIEVSRDAYKIVQKKLPYIQDILDVVAEKTECICGFINADIILEHMSEQMYEYIYEEAKDSLIYIRRNEIVSMDDIPEMNWTIHFDGIDMFLIDKNMVKNFFDDGFFVQSCWDLCILIKSLLLGITIKELVNPIAFHIKHKQEWNFDLMNRLVQNFYEKYYGERKNAYKKAMEIFYSCVLHHSKKICYCPKKCDEKFLLIYSENIVSVVESEFHNVKIFQNGMDINCFDFYVYLNQDIPLEECFFKEVIYLFSKYQCKEVIFNSFFVSEIGGMSRYNEINRCMDVLVEVNKAMKTYIRVEGKKRKKGCANLTIPIVNAYMDLEDKNIIKKIIMKKNIFIAPSGIRANEWLQLYQEKLNSSKVIGYLDKDIKKIGTDINDITIYDYSILEKYDEEYNVILASKYFNKEIERQLLKQISHDKILNASYILTIGNNGIVYYLDIKNNEKKYYLQ